MSRPNPIRKIMESPLPGLTEQRQQLFRPKLKDITYCYNILNKHIFDNKLNRPKITIGRLRQAWGECTGFYAPQRSGSWCTIRLSDKWFCPQWFLNTLAHEMVHQYQWDVISDDLLRFGRNGIMNHGDTFHMWRERFQQYGLSLKASHTVDRWFVHQNFKRC